jgi:hypothetical protein
VVVILGNVDLRIRWDNCAQQTCSDKPRNGKYRLQALPFTTMACLLVQRYRK